MSCQQVPRISEDPYVFTETVPAPPTLFNPPFRKITSFISNPIPANEIQKPKPAFSKQKQAQARLISQSQPNLSPQLFANRINGAPSLKGHAVRHVPSNGVKVTGGQQPQVHVQQQLTQPNLIQTNARQLFAPQILSWSPSPQESAPGQPPLLYSASNQPTIVTTATVTSSPLLPPSNFHKNTLSQHMQNFLPHSTGPIPAYVVQSQPKQVQKLLPPQPTVLQPQPATPQPQTHIPNNHSDLNDIPVNVIFRNSVASATPQADNSPTVEANINTAPVAAKLTTTPIVNKKLPTANASSTKLVDSSKPSKQKENKKRKAGEKARVFVSPPAKRDSRVLSSSNSSTTTISNTNSTANTNKKSLKSHLATGTPPPKAKRSYGLSAHHEALQRILNISKTLGTSSTSSKRKWHAPGGFMFDVASPFDLNSAAVICDSIEPYKNFRQAHWLHGENAISLPSTANISREQRIELKKAQLRRQGVQLIREKEFQTAHGSRRSLVFVSKVLQKLKQEEEKLAEKQCSIASCTNRTLTGTTYCYMHITQSDDQHLFFSCTAKFSDNSQCQVPVFDISHDLPLCRLHAWKHDNYDRFVQDQKQPKKAPRKRTKASAMTRPQKRSKKKRKTSSSATSAVDSASDYSQSVPATLAPPSLTTIAVQQPQQRLLLETENPSHDSIMMGYDVKLNGTIHHYPLQQQQMMLHHQPQENYFNVMERDSAYSILSMNNTVNTQDILSMCENSSQYESSEDTGVGGLSETELIGGHDVIEEIPLGGTELLDTDFSNVFCQLPDDAINSLFNAVQREEQEEVARALELADKQVKSLEQMTGDDTSYLGDFLGDCVDDPILDDTDICSEVVLHSPDTSGIDTSTLFIDGGSNSTGSCSTTPSDLRGLVQT